MALCSGLAPLINNHFGRRALLRGRLRLHAINATALIEETVIFCVNSAGWSSSKFCADAAHPSRLPEKLGPPGSKRLGSHYRSGRSPDWLKFKNPDAPAVKREAEEDWDGNDRRAIDPKKLFGAAADH